MTDPLAVRALTDTDTRRFLIPFIGRERPIREVAAELGAGLNTTLHKVRRLVRLGLLEVSREVGRRGRAVKYYRASADAFFIPYASTRHASPEDWLLSEFSQRERVVARSAAKAALAWGLERGGQSLGKRIYLAGDGGVVSDFGFDSKTGMGLEQSDAPAVVYTYEFPRLTRPQAKALQRELTALLGRFGGAGAGAPYAVRVAMAPLAD